MHYPVLEARHAAVAAGILALLWLLGRRAGFQRQQGWPVILSGLCLILLATLLDAAAALSPAGSALAGSNLSGQARLFVSIGTLLGLGLVGSGALLWWPALTRSRLEQTAIARSHVKLKIRLAESTAECKAANEQLEREIRERRQLEEALSRTIEESERREKEVSALLLAACGVLEHKSFYHNARALLEACRNLTGATAGYVALSSPSGGELNVLILDTGAGPALASDLPPLPVGGLGGEVYRRGKVAYDNLAGAWEKTLLPGVSLGAENVLFAPVLIKGNVAGVLCIANKDGGFGANDATLAEAFADLTALGLYNTQLLELVKATDQRLRMLMDYGGEGLTPADVQGLIASWDQAVEAVFGRSASAMIEPSLPAVPEAAGG